MGESDVYDGRGAGGIVVMFIVHFICKSVGFDSEHSMYITALLHACVMTPWAFFATASALSGSERLDCGDIGHSRMLLCAGSFAVYEMAFTSCPIGVVCRSGMWE